MSCSCFCLCVCVPVYLCLAELLALYVCICVWGVPFSNCVVITLLGIRLLLHSTTLSLPPSLSVSIFLAISPFLTLSPELYCRSAVSRLALSFSLPAVVNDAPTRRLEEREEDTKKKKGPPTSLVPVRCSVWPRDVKECDCRLVLSRLDDCPPQSKLVVSSCLSCSPPVTVLGS